MQGDPSHAANGGKLYIKGATVDQALHSPNRLTQALTRADRNAKLAPVPLDHALDAAAERLQSIIALHGSDAVAFYVSGRATAAW